MNRRRQRQQRDYTPPPSLGEKVRLNRYIASAGICSRRKADELIETGRVRVNGKTVSEFATFVEEGDTVEVNGRTISPTNNVYIVLNKPSDTISTTSDEKDRSTVLDLVDNAKFRNVRLYPVGRLDRDTVGVLLLTNDGELANRLMHPKYEVEKIYVVTTKRPVKAHELELLKEGVQLEDGLAAVDEAAYVAADEHKKIGISIHEGKNRQVRRMMETLGHDVVHLARIKYAGITVSGVRRGKWRLLKDHEVKRLRLLVQLK